MPNNDALRPSFKRSRPDFPTRHELVSRRKNPVRSSDSSPRSAHAVRCCRSQFPFAEEDFVRFRARQPCVLELGDDDISPSAPSRRSTYCPRSLSLRGWRACSPPVTAATAPWAKMSPAISAHPRGCPKQLKPQCACDLRGSCEVILTKAAFFALELSAKAAGIPVFANPRNSVAASLRQKDSRITAVEPASASLAYSG